MKTEHIPFDEIQELTEIYKQKTFEELSLIKPRWAIGKHIKELRDFELNPINNSYSFYSVLPREIIANAEFLEVETDTLFNGLSNNDFRITRLLHRWENGYFVDPPSISLSESKRILRFCDGRHRTKLSYLLMFETMPIAVINQDVDEIKNLIKLASI